MTIFGWDASDYDWQRRPLDLIEARAAGIAFFTHKATEGTRVAHMHCGQALAAARDAGIPLLGAYMVPRTPVAGKDGAVAEQVAYLLRYLDANVPWWRTFPGWFFQVDLERWQYDSVSPEIGVATCQAIEQATGHRPVLYASRGQYGDSIPSTRYPLWNASYAGNPAQAYTAAYRGDGSPDWQPYSGQAPIILQYGSQATIGTQRMCDINAFRGTVDQLRVALGITKGPNPMGKLVLYRHDGDPNVYLSDGMNRRVVPPGDIPALQGIAQGANPVFDLFKGGEIQVMGNPGAFGSVNAFDAQVPTFALDGTQGSMDAAHVLGYANHAAWAAVDALKGAALTDAAQAAIVAAIVVELKSAVPSAHDVAAAIIDTLRPPAVPTS